MRTCHLDGTHGFLNGAAVFLYAPGREREPHVVEVAPPEGWSVATALPGGPTTFTARDYDELADSPIEIGRHRLVPFTALGKPHEIVVWGRGNVDEARLADDARRIVETLGGLMGGLPYERYLFILHLSERRRGGLEHAALDDAERRPDAVLPARRLRGDARALLARVLPPLEREADAARRARAVRLRAGAVHAPPLVVRGGDVLLRGARARARRDPRRAEATCATSAARSRSSSARPAPAR